jgi:hypothetical protein
MVIFSKGDVNGHLRGGGSATQMNTPLEFLIKTPGGVEIVVRHETIPYSSDQITKHSLSSRALIVRSPHRSSRIVCFAALVHV